MRKERGKGPDILNLGTRRRRVVSFISRPFYPLWIGVWVSQSRSVRHFREEKNVFSLPRIKQLSFPFSNATPYSTKGTFPELLWQKKALYIKSLYCCEKAAKFTIDLEMKRKVLPVTMNTFISSQYIVVTQATEMMCGFWWWGNGEQCWHQRSVEL